MSDFPYRSTEKTLDLTVGNVGFLLDRLGQDCHPLQFLRELTQNSIEAIERCDDPSGEIVWDVDWDNYDLTGIYKLCVIDNGDGMTGPDMVQYINKLSSSTAEQSFIGNYGVGAKIAAATRNHEGLLYLSWRDSVGSMIHLWRDPSSNHYGLRQIRRPDGTYGHHGRIDPAVRPEMIKQHGTKVVLLGNSQDADTMTAPEGAASPSRWISKYLNTRYFRFPDGIAVRAREGWANPRDDRDRNYLRTLTGQEPYLAAHAESSGTLRLTGATAHWWILKDEPALKNNSGFVESSGHVAALYNNELYELASARGGMARLQQFGIILGYRYVVIYIEPTPHVGQLTTNTARTHLLANGEPLPWDEWAAEFRERMPSDIRDLIERLAAGSSSHDHAESIRERLRRILDLYKVSRYRPTPAGNMLVDPDTTARGGVARQAGEDRSGTQQRGGKRGGAAGGIYSIFLDPDGVPGTDVNPDPFPDVRWVSVEDGTREQGDMEDRAAKFLLDQNLLLINADFRVFADMSSYFVKQYESSPAVQEVVTDAVQAWFEQALVESVIGVQVLQNAQEWTIAEIKEALSPEALTTAVMPRYHVNNAVRRELGAKLGKIREQ